MVVPLQTFTVKDYKILTKQGAEAYICRIRARSFYHSTRSVLSAFLTYRRTFVLFAHPLFVAGSSRNRFGNLTRILRQRHVFTLLNRVLNDLNITPTAASVLRLTLSLSPCRPLSLRFVRRLINLCSRHRTAEAPVRHVSPLIPPLGRTNGTALARYARKSADCPFELSGPITCGCVPAGTTRNIVILVTLVEFAQISKLVRTFRPSS